MNPPSSIVYEIAAVRLRQRRLLKMLREKNILDWDGAIPTGDPELEALAEQIRTDWGKRATPSMRIRNLNSRKLILLHRASWRVHRRPHTRSPLRSGRCRSAGGEDRPNLLVVLVKEVADAFLVDSVHVKMNVSVTADSRT